MSDRPLRYCDVCGGLDDHPRHVRQIGKSEPDLVLSSEFLDGLEQGPITAIAQLVDPRKHVRHMDCCAAAGCVVCQETEVANGGRRGRELIDFLTAPRVEV